MRRSASFFKKILRSCVTFSQVAPIGLFGSDSDPIRILIGSNFNDPIRSVNCKIEIRSGSYLWLKKKEGIFY